MTPNYRARALAKCGFLVDALAALRKTRNVERLEWGSDLPMLITRSGQKYWVKLELEEVTCP